MEHSQADPRDVLERRLGERFGVVALGGGVSLALLLLYGVWEYAFGHLSYLADYSLGSPEMGGPRIALVVIVLIGFLVGSRAYGRRAIARDIGDVRPLLSACSAQEYAELLREEAGSARSAWVGSLAALPIGLLVVTGERTAVPFLLSGEPWSHDLVLAIAYNLLLFAILGRLAMETLFANRLFARLESRLGPVDLLRPQALVPFARRGLRNAFLWIGGSSIASIIFVNQSFSWLTGLVLTATLLIGTLAFLGPLRSLRHRIQHAKRAELERVRAAIERARDALLDPAASAAEGASMPGLLAYEQRIVDVPEWPLAAPQIARFALVVAIGLGSWLGGAVVDHLVDTFLR